MVRMTKQEYATLLRNYDPSNEDQRKQFEKITYRYPYFQSAYAHYLKSLKTQKQYNFQLILRKTAILSPERNALMHWLNSEKKEHNERKEALNPTLEKTPETITEPKKIIAKETVIAKKTQKEIITKTAESKQKNVQKKKPSKEKLAMSFADWISYSAQNKIENQERTPNLDEKITLIDSFLKNQPKIPPVKQDQPKVDLSTQNEFNKEELMTETLAKVYLQQKKFKKALYAYKILSLKYPEKNSFFADQIKKIKKLQQNS